MSPINASAKGEGRNENGQNECTAKMSLKANAFTIDAIIASVPTETACMETGDTGIARKLKLKNSEPDAKKVFYDKGATHNDYGKHI